MTRHDRRHVLHLGVLAVGVGALAACSSDDDPPPEVADDLETSSEPEDRASVELALTNTALSLEVLIFDTYQAGFDLGFVQSAELLDAMTLLQQHHAEHRATLTALVEAAEGEPFTTANPVIKAALVDPTLASVAVEGDFVRLVHDLEQASAELYVHAATMSRSAELRSAVMAIGAVASRRATVLDLLGDFGTERTAVYPVDNPLPADAIVPS